MSAQADPLPTGQSEQSRPETAWVDPGTVVAFASERARNAQRAWREAQQSRLQAAQRAERLALQLKAAEEQAEAGIAAASAAAVARRQAQQRRIDAAARAERLENKLRSAAEAGERVSAIRPLSQGDTRAERKSMAARFVAAAAIGLVVGATASTLGRVAVDALYAPATSALSVPGASPGEALQLRLTYRFDAPGSR